MEYLSKLMNSTGAQVTFICETRSSKITPVQLNTRFNIAGSLVVPSVGLSGASSCCGLMKFKSPSSSRTALLF